MFSGALTIKFVPDFLFENRREAGRVLAGAVAAAGLPHLESAVVLGLARGGVPVGFEVAAALHLLLDVMIVRKIGAPGCEEFAMGAVASGGAVVLNREVVHNFHVSEAKLQHLIEARRAEIERLETLYRQGRPPVEFGEGGVILVDDGLATGASMRAAIGAVRPRATRVVVAVPVAARSSCDAVRQEVDDLICAATPKSLEAVSLFYREFGPTSDEEVRSLLENRGQGSGVRDQIRE